MRAKRSDVDKWLKASQKEYSEYKTSKDDEKLGQAGEKLWNAHNHLIEVLSKKQLKSAGAIYEEVTKLHTVKEDVLFIDCYRDCYDLHKYFYRGWTELPNEIETLYERSLFELKSLMKKYLK